MLKSNPLQTLDILEWDTLFPDLLWRPFFLLVILPDQGKSPSNMHSITPNLGVTKEIMSRGPQVVDIEYRELDVQSIALEGPFLSLMHPTHHQQQHPPHWPGSHKAVGFAP